MMKKIACLITLLFCLTLSSYSQKIVMTMSGEDPNKSAGQAVKALQLPINAQVDLAPGSGGSVSLPKPDALTIKTDLGKYSELLLKNMLKGTQITDIVFTYFDQANTPFYKITLLSTVITEFQYLSPECPTCIKLEQQIGFTFYKVQFTDLKTNTSVIWDVAKAVVQ